MFTTGNSRTDGYISKRFSAALIDGLVVGLLFALISEVYLSALIVSDVAAKADFSPFSVGGAVVLAFWGAIGEFAVGFIDGIFVFLVPLQLFQQVNKDRDLLWLTLALLAANWLYHAIMESSSGQATLGKRAMKMQVTDSNGTRISFLRATARHFSKILPTLPLLAGYLLLTSSLNFDIAYSMIGMVLAALLAWRFLSFNEKKQALHDRLARCLVVESGRAII